MFKLSVNSLNKLKDVEPKLIAVAVRALQLTPVDFGVTCGLRTVEEQQVLYNAGKSKTLNSKHLPNKRGLAEAIDVAAYIDGKLTWHYPEYEKIAVAFKQAAKELNVPIKWGGDFKSFKDGVHFQLES